MGEPQDGSRPVHLLIEPRRTGLPRGFGALAAGAAFLLLVALTSHVAAWLGPATDLYSRWYGLRRLLLAGENPYGAEVTRALASHMPFLAEGVEPVVPRDALASAFGFLYPLPGVLFLAPLALLPYRAALTLWMVAVLTLLPVAAWLAVDAVSPAAQAGRGGGTVRRLALPLGLLFVPALANLIHGQLAPAVVFALALALRLSRSLGSTPSGRPFLAGFALAAGAAVKPHLVIFLVPLWLGSNLRRWRRGGEGAPEAGRFLAGALLSAGALVAVATLLLPSWPFDFLAAAGAYVSLTRVEYADVTNAVLPGGPAVWRLAEPLLPAPLSWAVAGVATALLLAWAVAGWGQRAGEPWEESDTRGIARTLVVSALIIPPAWETNAALLLVPLAILLGQLAGRPVLALALAGSSVLLSALDLALYATQPWRNAPLLIAAYALLLAAFGLAARARPVGRWPLRTRPANPPPAPAPGAAGPSLRG
jgi:hypothetical protein